MQGKWTLPAQGLLPLWLAKWLEQFFPMVHEGLSCASYVCMTLSRETVIPVHLVESLKHSLFCWYICCFCDIQSVNVTVLAVKHKPIYCHSACFTTLHSGKQLLELFLPPLSAMENILHYFKLKKTWSWDPKSGSGNLHSARLCPISSARQDTKQKYFWTELLHKYRALEHNCTLGQNQNRLSRCLHTCICGIFALDSQNTHRSKMLTQFTWCQDKFIFLEELPCSSCSHFLVLVLMIPVSASMCVCVFVFVGRFLFVAVHVWVCLCVVCVWVWGWIVFCVYAKYKSDMVDDMWNVDNRTLHRKEKLHWPQLASETELRCRVQMGVWPATLKTNLYQKIRGNTSPFGHFNMLHHLCFALIQNRH